MPVTIHNKQYFTVAERLKTFREDEKYEGWTISTDLIRFLDDDCVIRATILDPSGKSVATGIAHEVRGSTNINSTSHVENCETSAIGRALACLGLAGTEYASADEVTNAINNQELKESYKKASRHSQTVLRFADTILAIKAGIASGVLSEASEAWFELDEEFKADLWLAPTKGGVFSTKEIEVIKSREFREAHYGSGDEK